jgi:hypothetical protein
MAGSGECASSLFITFVPLESLEAKKKLCNRLRHLRNEMVASSLRHACQRIRPSHQKLKIDCGILRVKKKRKWRVLASVQTRNVLQFLSLFIPFAPLESLDAKDGKQYN